MNQSIKTNMKFMVLLIIITIIIIKSVKNVALKNKNNEHILYLFFNLYCSVKCNKHFKSSILGYHKKLGQKLFNFKITIILYF